MRWQYIVAVFIMGVLLSGCSSLQVTHDYDRHVDFTRLSHVDVTYVAQDDGENFARERIVQQLKETLRKRGFNSVSKENADIHVKVYLSIVQKSRTETSYDYVPAAFVGYYRPRYFNRPFPRPLYRQRYCNQGVVYRMNTTYDYEEQQLIVEMSEARTHRIVWHAIAVDTFSTGDTERYSREYIETVVQKVLEDFPPH